MVFSSVYRIIQTYPNSFLYQVINDDVWLCTVAFSIFSALEIIFVGPILLEIPNHEILKEKIIEDVPIMGLAFTLHPSISGYHPALSEGWIAVLLRSTCIISVLLPLWFGGTHVYFIHRMIYLQKHETFATWKLHRMLYRLVGQV